MDETICQCSETDTSQRNIRHINYIFMDDILTNTCFFILKKKMKILHKKSMECSSVSTLTDIFSFQTISNVYEVCN